MSYAELNLLVDAVAASLASLGLPDLIIWYNDSDNFHLWEGDIPHNLTVFSADFYHPKWMYPGIGDVRDVYNEWLFPKLGPETQVFVVPPTFGNTMGCNGVNDQFCVNLTLSQWEVLTL